MRFALTVFAVAVVHAFVSFLCAFSGGISGGTSGAIYRTLANILLFPLSVFPPTWKLGEVGGWVAWGLVSLAWGVAVALLLRRFLAPNVLPVG